MSGGLAKLAAKGVGDLRSTRAASREAVQAQTEKAAKASSVETGKDKQ